jgi:hypothetical protein
LFRESDQPKIDVSIHWITPALYKQYGYLFFKLYEEKSGVKGNFSSIQSVAQLDRDRSVERNDDESELDFAVVELNSADRKTEFMPVSLMKSLLRENDVADKL